MRKLQLFIILIISFTTLYGCSEDKTTVAGNNEDTKVKQLKKQIE